LSHGAPSALLTGVHQAALDEVRHAELCFSLAERFGNLRVRPGAFPFTGAPTGTSSLAEFAAASLREGCLAETLGAHVTEVAASLAPDPEVRQALASIAAEEATHAVLSFRIVAWALEVGGSDVRAAVKSALARPWPRLDVNELAIRSNVAVEALAAAAEQGVREVLEPAVTALLRA
jgi:1,2-phenylacetyl-CoA epoxidase catalytic subunit